MRLIYFMVNKSITVLTWSEEKTYKIIYRFISFSMSTGNKNKLLIKLPSALRLQRLNIKYDCASLSIKAAHQKLLHKQTERSDGNWRPETKYQIENVYNPLLSLLNQMYKLFLHIFLLHFKFLSALWCFVTYDVRWKMFINHFIIIR